MTASLLQLRERTCENCLHFDRETPAPNDKANRNRVRAWVQERRKSASKSKSKDEGRAYAQSNRNFDPTVDIPDPWEAVDWIIGSMGKCNALSQIYGEPTFQLPSATCPSSLGPNGEILTMLYTPKSQGPKPESSIPPVPAAPDGGKAA